MGKKLRAIRKGYMDKELEANPVVLHKKNADVQMRVKKYTCFLFNARTTCHELKLRLKNADFTLFIHNLKRSK